MDDEIGCYYGFTLMQAQQLQTGIDLGFIETLDLSLDTMVRAIVRLARRILTVL